MPSKKSFSYGTQTKEEGKRLLEALLKYVDGEFEEDFDIKFGWRDEESNNPKLIVETTLRDLEWLTKECYQGQGKLTKNKIRDLLNHYFKEFLEILADNRTQVRGSDKWHFTLTLWAKDKDTNVRKFEETWKDKQPEKSKACESNVNKSNQFDWKVVCRQSLAKQKQLTSKRLMKADATVFDIDQLHVPLALVQRKKPDRRSGDDNPEFSQLYQPEYEEQEKLKFEEFLRQILGFQENRRIAIIGEPGAGKTTLLQHIAFEILERNNLPIWISLRNLGHPAPKFQDVLNNWLEGILNSELEERQADFKKQLKDGKVWFLLDGVDEMAASGSPLNFINEWIPTKYSNCGVILTCRLNVWEANPYALDSFKSYRTLQFSPEDVERFIRLWFENDTEVAQRLLDRLNNPINARIKDLVKNPLRLTLLCFISHLNLGEGEFPNTKAELYNMYVREFYRWKEDEFPITYSQKKQLNFKLGQLAQKALDQKEKRFCLSETFVKDEFGDDSLFDLAINKLAWLNQVGVDATPPNEPVYAFYHPTFQEYFAARYIVDEPIDESIDKSTSKVKLQQLVTHINKFHWREIFQLIVQMLTNSDDFLQLLKQHIDTLLARDEKAQQFLFWINHRLLIDNEVRFKSVAVRAFYFALHLSIDQAYRETMDPHVEHLALIIDEKLNLTRNLDHVLADKFSIDIGNHPNFPSNYSLGEQIEYKIGAGNILYPLVFILSTERTIVNMVDRIIDYMQMWSEYQSNWSFLLNLLHGLLETVISCADGLMVSYSFYSSDLLDQLQQIKAQVPAISKNSVISNAFSNEEERYLNQWFQNNSQIWIEQLKIIILKHFNYFCLHWRMLDQEQKILLMQYYDNNEFLIELLKNANSVTSEMKEDIEETLLLPIFRNLFSENLG